MMGLAIVRQEKPFTCFSTCAPFEKRTPYNEKLMLT